MQADDKRAAVRSKVGAMGVARSKNNHDDCKNLNKHDNNERLSGKPWFR